MFIFPVQLTTSGIGNLTRLVPHLQCVMTVHTLKIRVQKECFNENEEEIYHRLYHEMIKLHPLLGQHS